MHHTIEPLASPKPDAPARALFDGNLNALRRLQPELASELEQLPFTSFAALTTGRDGSRTFLIHGEDGRGTWFGRSSMPTVSVPQEFANMRHLGGNVSLPGILTGLPPLVIAERIPAACAIFVFERHLWAVQLAMHLHDYRPLLTTGRLVFIMTDRLRSEFGRFFTRNPGYEIPAHLFNLAQLAPTEVGELQRLIETAGDVVAQVQLRAVREYADSLKTRTPRQWSDRPRVAIVSGTGSSWVLRLANRVQRALESFGWAHEVCVPSEPAKCHLAARMRAIAGFDPDVVFCLERGTGSLRSWLPQSIPIVTWGSEGAAPSETSGSARGPFDCVLTHEQVADDVTFRPIDLSPADREAFGAEVAIVGNLPDDRPEASEISLTSHVALWRTLQELAAAEIRRSGAVNDGLLTAAQRLSGTALNDERLLDRFRQGLYDRIALAIVGRQWIEILAAGGIRVAAWGRRWDVKSGPTVRLCGPIPDADTRNKVFNAADWVVVHPSDRDSLETVLDALAAGAQVVCHDTAKRWQKDVPGLWPVLSSIRFVGRGEELTKLVQASRRTHRGATSQSPDVRPVIEQEHSLRATLARCIDMVRQRLLSGSDG